MLKMLSWFGVLPQTNILLTIACLFDFHWRASRAPVGYSINHSGACDEATERVQVRNSANGLPSSFLEDNTADFGTLLNRPTTESEPVRAVYKPVEGRTGGLDRARRTHAMGGQTSDLWRERFVAAAAAGHLEKTTTVHGHRIHADIGQHH